MPEIEGSLEDLLGTEKLPLNNQFSEVFFQRVPFQDSGRGDPFVEIATLRRLSSLLRPNGRVVIRTGHAAPVGEIEASLRQGGFEVSHQLTPGGTGWIITGKLK